MLAASAMFFLIHMFPATPLRARAIELLGEQRYTALFAVAALATLVWLIYSFNAAPIGENLWTVPEVGYLLLAALMLFAFILAVAGYMAPNPSIPGGDLFLEKENVGEGIFAITRHPAMWGIAIWAIAHAIGLATVRGFLFFGTFALTALIGSWMQQRRKRARLAGWAAFEAKTSFWPFAAILDDRAKLNFKAVGWLPFAIAVIIWAVILHIHAWLFGVPPLPFRV